MDPDKEVMGYWFDWKSGDSIKKHLFEIDFCFDKSEVYLNLEKTKEVEEMTKIWIYQKMIVKL